jgi:oligopeptide/dipeptide ABC transporter ATP-binding protein
MTEQLLVVESLQKHYVQNRSMLLRTQAGVVKAVDGVSFQVPVGATLGLVGESGCGKSTTARLLLRLEDPSGGRIQFDGKDVQDAVGAELRAYRTNVQAVFQDPYSSLNPRMRVAGIIAEPLSANRPVSKGELRDAVAQAMQTVGLNPHWAERFPHEFSGGQRQRIAIARSLILRPRLMILDEPVSALDVSIRAQILNLLMDLQEQFGLSYLLISHDLDVIAEMCNEIAVMYLGQIVEIGPAAEIVANPRHPYTQALFSARLPAHPDGASTRIRLKGEIPSPLDPPSGCRFRTRCPYVMPVCADLAPPVTQLPGGQRASCHLLTEGAALSA